MSDQFDSALPQYELGKVETDAGFFKALFHLHAIQAMNCIPAIVESYDRATHTASVRPLIKYETRVTDGRLAFDRPLYTVPVHQICQGGFLIDAPMFAGDTGLLFSIDRDWITAKKENNKVVLKNRDPKKVDKDDNKGPVVADSDGILSFEYGFFLPCSWAETGLSDKDGVVVKIPTKDGVVAIKIDRDGKVTFGGEVKFEKKIYGTDAEFSGLVKAKDFKTDDCEILELDVVTDAKTDNGVTTLTIKKFKFLRSQAIGDSKEVEVVGGTIEGDIDVDITSEDESISVDKTVKGGKITFNIETNVSGIEEIIGDDGIYVSGNGKVVRIQNTGVLSITDGDETKATGNVSVAANSGSGLSVGVTGGSNGAVSLDLKDRASSDVFGIKELKVTDENGVEGTTETTTKFLGTENINIKIPKTKDLTVAEEGVLNITPGANSGGGSIKLTGTGKANDALNVELLLPDFVTNIDKSQTTFSNGTLTLALTTESGETITHEVDIGSSSEEQSQTIEVITGITPSFEAGKLMLTLKKQSVKILSVEGKATEEEVDVPIFDTTDTIDVVTDVAYSTETFKFTKKTRSVPFIVDDLIGEETEADVFDTTPLSGEVEV